MRDFCKCKSYSHFFSKNVSIYAICNDQSFIDTLANVIVIFEQLDPGISHSTLLILMHLHMYCDVWLDNVKNLWRYILRYTVRNPTSSRNMLLIGWHLVLRSSQNLSLCANSTFFQQKKMNKCIRMGITSFKFVIWGKSVVLRSAEASP